MHKPETVEAWTQNNIFTAEQCVQVDTVNFEQ